VLLSTYNQETTSKFRNVLILSAFVNLYENFHALSMCIYPRTNFHIPHYNNSLIIAIERKVTVDFFFFT